MSVFQQMLWVLGKDLREHRWAIAGLLAIDVALILAHSESWASAVRDNHLASRYRFDAILAILPVTAWLILIARVIHGDPLPGDRAFWLTRPYHRAALLLAKLFFILTTITIPFALAQVLILAFSGVPIPMDRLLWNQALIAMIFLIPAAAVAAFTRNLAQFLFVGIVGGAALVMIPRLSFNSMRYSNSQAWAQLLLTVAAVASIGAVALLIQYWRRRTMKYSIVFIVAVMAVSLAIGTLPTEAAIALRGKLNESPNHPITVTVLPPDGGALYPEWSRPERPVMIIPVSLAGVAESDISVVWELVTLKTPKGTFRPAGFTSAPGRQYLRFDLSRAVFDTWKDTPIRLTASYSVAIFSEVGSVDLFEKGQPVRSPVLGQCGIAEGTRFQWGRRILCRNAFETHGTQLSQVTEDAIVAQGWEGSSIDMRLDPIVEQVYPPYLVDSPRLQASKLRLTVREPRAIAQGTIEIPDLRLADYAASR